MIRLQVTQKNITEGRHADGCQCPIALAAVDAGLTPVRVGPSFIHWGAPGDQHSAKLPPEAVEWERRYDYGHSMAPITFDVEPFPTIPVT